MGHYILPIRTQTQTQIPTRTPIPTQTPMPTQMPTRTRTQKQTPIPTSDTWIWDGEDWIELTSATSPARAGHAAAWDPSTRAVVLFGGVDDAGAFATDTLTSSVPDVVITP